jgi:hypothetical protein
MSTTSVGTVAVTKSNFLPFNLASQKLAMFQVSLRGQIRALGKISQHSYKVLFADGVVIGIPPQLQLENSIGTHPGIHAKGGTMRITTVTVQLSLCFVVYLSECYGFAVQLR